ncbi:MAG: ABC transporter permease [Prevotella sp.]
MVIRFLIEKEFKQMIRNIILPIVFILLPIGMINVMPRAATQEVKDLKIGVIDNDHSTWSQRMIQKMAASEYFTLTELSDSYHQGLDAMERAEVDFIIEIEPDFERRLVRDGISQVMISANAVNGVKAGLGTSYLSQIVADYSANLREEFGMSTANVRVEGFDVEPRYMFNAELDYKAFMVPGLIAMLLILVVGFLPALNIVGEKEKGTIEQINVTPVGRFEFIFSKLIPYWCVGLFILAYSMLLAKGIYGQTPVGSIAVIFLFATLFILVVSCMGLIVSNYSDTTQQAALVMFFFLVIFILLSGLLTPIAGMPEWAKLITRLNPLRYFIEAMRALYLKGSSLSDLSGHFIALSVYAASVWAIAIFSYKKSN